MRLDSVRPIIGLFLSVVTVALSSHGWAEEEFSGAAVGAYQEPGFSSGRDYSVDSQVDSVDPFTGALKIAVQDLFLPGNGGLDISVVRNYQSVTNTGPYSNGRSSRTPFGTGWDIHFGRVLVTSQQSFINNSSNAAGCKIGQVSSKLNPILELPDGSRDVLVDADGTDYAFITKGRWIGECLPSGAENRDGGLLVTSPEGLEYLFNVKGQVALEPSSGAYLVSKITDPDGNYLKFTYNTDSNFFKVLTRINSSDGRVVSFNYSDEDGALARLTSVSGEGRSATYSYVDAAYAVGPRAQYLKRVGYSDGSDWNYTYNDVSSPAGESNGRYSMATMTSPLGLKTTYGYDIRQMGPDVREKLNVVVERSQSNISGSADGGHVWNYTYDKGYAPNNDFTQVSGDAQCVRYDHVGTNTINSGVTGVDRGLWKVGLLVRKEIRSPGCGTLLRSETFTWDSQKVSSQNEMRRYTLLVENDTLAPVLEKKVISQDGTSYSTSYSYDQYGYPASLSEDGQKSRTTTISYTRPSGKWILGRISTRKISGVSGNTTYSYFSNGRINNETAYGVVTSYSYTGAGDIASITDANGFTTTHSDYYRGVPRKTVYPDGAVEQRGVNSRGTVASVTDPLGHKTTYTYDSMDRLSSITPPKGESAKTIIDYSVGSGIRETLTRGNYQRVRQYNQLGWMTGQTESGGSAAIVMSTTYRANGQKAFASYPAYGAASAYGDTFSSDGLGRVTAVTHGDGSIARYNYQGGNSVSITDERGKVTVQKYVSFGEPGERFQTSTTQPGNLQTVVDVDNIGRVTSIVQGGLSRTFDYNGKGFLETETNPETGATLYTYDAVGNVKSKQVGSAATDTFNYDKRNRLLDVTYGGNANLKLTNTYDLDGLLRSQTFFGTSWGYDYDSHNKLISETLTLDSPARTRTISYGYDAMDRLTRLTYPSGLVVDYAPDAYGRATKAGTYASNIAYHPNGLLKALTYGNGRVLSVAQEATRLELKERLVGGPELPMRLQYGFDDAGNLTQINNLQNSSLNQTLGYDDLNRLTSARGAWGAATYGYNSRGDLTTQTIGDRSLTYTYDAQGRLASLSGGVTASFSYDAKGNVLQGRGQYAYNKANNLSFLCLVPNSDCAASPDQRFSYDGRGNRVVQTMADGEQILSLYGTQGQLLWQENLLDQSKQEFIYVAGERIADRERCEDVDTDNDGMPNCFERRFDFDRRDLEDALKDADGDGLSNLLEYQLGSLPRNLDSDADGLPDIWEWRNGLNPAYAGDADIDSDGDGITNADEYVQGKKPTRRDALGPTVAPVIDLLLN